MQARALRLAAPSVEGEKLFLRIAMLLLGEQARFVFSHGRVSLCKPPLSDKAKIATLGFLNHVGAFDDEPVEIIGDACIDLFFLTHDVLEKRVAVRNALQFELE
jgi:hypothetical protein